jgi:hypothetical protein
MESGEEELDERENRTYVGDTRYEIEQCGRGRCVEVREY